MPIKIECAGCGKWLKLRDELAGKVIKCPACGDRTRVPVGEQAETTPLPTAPTPPAPASPVITAQGCAEGNSFTEPQDTEADPMSSFLERLASDEGDRPPGFPDVTSTIPRTAAGAQGFFRLTPPAIMKVAGLALSGSIWSLAMIFVIYLFSQGAIAGALLLAIVSTALAAGLVVLAIGSFRDFQIESSTGSEKTLIITRYVGFMPFESSVEITQGAFVRHTSAVYSSSLISKLVMLFIGAALLPGLIGLIFWFQAFQKRKVHWVEIAGGALGRPAQVFMTPDLRRSNEFADDIASVCGVPVARRKFRGEQGLLSTPHPPP